MPDQCPILDVSMSFDPIGSALLLTRTRDWLAEEMHAISVQTFRGMGNGAVSGMR